MILLAYWAMRRFRTRNLVTRMANADLTSRIQEAFRAVRLSKAYCVERQTVESILENIRLGKPDATTEEVERAARTAGIHDFIVSLPDGYDTMLGATSSKLSVGQKQRIGIARGLVKDSRVLILDEPTSRGWKLPQVRGLADLTCGLTA